MEQGGYGHAAPNRPVYTTFWPAAMLTHCFIGGPKNPGKYRKASGNSIFGLYEPQIASQIDSLSK
jgi:hypothetical protein